MPNKTEPQLLITSSIFKSKVIELSGFKFFISFMYTLFSNTGVNRVRRSLSQIVNFRHQFWKFFTACKFKKIMNKTYILTLKFLLWTLTLSSDNATSKLKFWSKYGFIEFFTVRLWMECTRRSFFWRDHRLFKISRLTWGSKAETYSR